MLIKIITLFLIFMTALGLLGKVRLLWYKNSDKSPKIRNNVQDTTQCPLCKTYYLKNKSCPCDHRADD